MLAHPAILAKIYHLKPILITVKCLCTQNICFVFYITVMWKKCYGFIYLHVLIFLLIVCNQQFYIFFFLYYLPLYILNRIKKRRNLKTRFQDLKCSKGKKRWNRICNFYENNVIREYSYTMEKINFKNWFNTVKPKIKQIIQQVTNQCII